MIRNTLRLIIPKFILNSIKKFRQKKEIKNWKKNGCPNPPPHYLKQLAILEYQKKYNYTTLVETGTYLGEMVEAVKKKFDKIISIELGEDLYNNAKNKFKNDKNITIIKGDSGNVLPTVMSKINDPAIFWLDGHYSAGITAKGEKECPIFEELNAIFQSKQLNHILLIDDARGFVGEGDYPTIEKLTDFVKSKNEKYQLEVKHDIIRFIISE
jgi:hypothetical protein